jgi:hypothetical protein
MNIKKAFNILNIVLALIFVAYIIYSYMFPELAPWISEPESRAEMEKYL